jgi:hypothetical protein
VIDASAIDPNRPKVIGEAEIGAANDFQVIRGTWVTDGEIISRLICHLDIVVDERRVRIPENVGIRLVFHHDQENMIERSKRRLHLNRKLIGTGNAAAQRRRGDRREKHSGQINPPSSFYHR